MGSWTISISSLGSPFIQWGLPYNILLWKSSGQNQRAIFFIQFLLFCSLSLKKQKSKSHFFYNVLGVTVTPLPYAALSMTKQLASSQSPVKKRGCRISEISARQRKSLIMTLWMIHGVPMLDHGPMIQWVTFSWYFWTRLQSLLKSTIIWDHWHRCEKLFSSWHWLLQSAPTI